LINFDKMKKRLIIFITWLLIALLVVTFIPLVKAQQEPSDKTSPNEGVPVVFDGNTVFFIKEKFGGISAERRATRTTQRIQEYAENYALSLENIEVLSADQEGIPLTTIVTGHIMLINVSDNDAKAVGKSRLELADEYVQKIKQVVSQYREERSLGYLIRGAIITGIISLILILFFLILNNLFGRIYTRLQNWRNTYISPVRLGNFELIRANQLDNVVSLITRLIQGIVILALLVIYVLFVLNQFPWTQGLASIFLKSLIKVLEIGLQNFITYLPNLLTIVLFITLTYSLLRLSNSFFNQLSQGIFSLPGFYPEWSLPTNRLITFLIVALASVGIFPLLPGFNSPAFQGISVFLGILFSLGSTSVIANIVSGTILIYTRAFRVGDRIKVGEIFGEVIETTLLVTRVLTPTHVVISIPNSQILSSSIENFNFAPKELNKPLILRTQVYLGYEVPWRQAYEALMEAALATNGVAKSPLPFVLQDELNEVYVTYFLNVYVDREYLMGKSGTDIEKARSQLHENIRDYCEKAGITIFAPSYEADPSNYGPVAVDAPKLSSND